MLNDKFILLDESIISSSGKTLYRIKATKSFSNVKSGDLGGFIEHESCLSKRNNAWVYGNARVFDNAQVYGDAWVYGDARVYGDAWVYDNVLVYGDASLSPISITGLYYNITITDTEIKIGCEFHTIKEWESFTDSAIYRMDGACAIDFWKENKSLIITLAKSHMAKLS